MKRRNFKQLSLGGPSLEAAPSQTSYKVLAVDNTKPVPRQNNTSSHTQAFFIEAQEKPLQNIQLSQGGSTKDHELVSQFSTLELNVEFKLDLRVEDIKVLEELGCGNGGTVSKAQHIPTGLFMARKVIPVEAKPAVRKQILRELHIMHDCNFPHIVSYYGAFLNEGDVVMCMEYMDKGSLDRISKKYGPIAEPIVGKITEAVVEGLDYLYDKHRIIHRDVKPSNILINHKGQIKLCDFGVSGELNNSIADTFVGTSTYMSPERIQGAAYSVKSDVWSLGITLLELAIGYFPWDETNEDGTKVASSHPMGILDMLQRIVLEPPPKLPENGNFTNHFRAFIHRCLLTEDQRPTPKDLFVSAIDCLHVALLTLTRKTLFSSYRNRTPWLWTNGLINFKMHLVLKGIYMSLLNIKYLFIQSVFFSEALRGPADVSPVSASCSALMPLYRPSPSTNAPAPRTVIFQVGVTLGNGLLSFA